MKGLSDRLAGDQFDAPAYHSLFLEASFVNKRFGRKMILGLKWIMQSFFACLYYPLCLCAR
jgi:hypothetical protein